MTLMLECVGVTKLKEGPTGDFIGTALWPDGSVTRSFGDSEKRRASE